jgi:hypothetical protein
MPVYVPSLSIIETETASIKIIRPAVRQNSQLRRIPETSLHPAQALKQYRINHYFPVT